jgi:hypothetical protein
MKKSGVKAAKLIHGYGSTGKGGRLPNPKFLQPRFKVQAVTFAHTGNPRQDRPGSVVGFHGLGEKWRTPGSRHIHQRKATVEFPADENLQIVVGMVADRNEFSCAVGHAFLR